MKGIGPRASVHALFGAAFVLSGCFDFGGLKPSAKDGGGEPEAAVEAGVAGGPIRPSFVSETNLADALAGTREVVLEEGAVATWDVDSGALLVEGEDEPRFTDAPILEPQAAGMPKLAIFAVAKLVVGKGATLRFTGPHAVVVSAAEEIDIAGTVTVSAQESVGGPGGATANTDGVGRWPVSGEAGSDDTSDLENANAASGAGGGGNGAPGGAGGSAKAKNGASVTELVEGGSGGATWDARRLLLGGGAGGASKCQIGGDTGAVAGGAGGGALLLASQTRVRVGAAARVLAAGAGAPAVPGPVHECATSARVAGGGGGAGGTLVLEAPVVDLLGALAANGGGGSGAGRNSTSDESARGKPGEDGRAGDERAAGGSPGTVSDSTEYKYGLFAGGDGGAGGTSQASGLAGEAGYAEKFATSSTFVVAGGGGGGAGRIEIRTGTGERDDAWQLSPSDAPLVTVEKVTLLED